jgi:hypothetical protein
MNNGTVISATLRNEDLIPAFLDCLENQENLKPHHKTLCEEIRERISFGAYWESEDADIDLNECLFDALNEYSPEGYYFGAHPGDGSDFGFWQSEETETV